MTQTVEINGTIFDVPPWSSVEEFECSVGVKGIPENPLSSLVSCKLYTKNPTVQEVAGDSSNILDIYKVQFKVPYGEGRELSDGIFRPVEISEFANGGYDVIMVDKQPTVNWLSTASKVDEYKLEDDGVLISFYADGLQDMTTVAVFASPTASFREDLEKYRDSTVFDFDLGENLNDIAEDFRLGYTKKGFLDEKEYTIGILLNSD